MRGLPGVAHLLLVVDVAPDVGQVGAVPEVVGGRLEDDVPAQPLPGRDGLLLGGRPGCAATASRRTPRAARPSSSSVERPAVRGADEGAGHDRPRPGPVGASPDRRSSASGALEPGGVLHGRGPARAPRRRATGTTAPSRGRRCCRRRRGPAAARGRPRRRGSVESTGLSDCSPTTASTLATSAPLVLTGGMNTASTASTSGSSIAASRARLEVLGVGLGAEAGEPAGSRARPRPRRRRPCSARASELPTIATRLPRGSGWWASSWATSNISSRVSTWMTPACRNIASTAAWPDSLARTEWPIGHALGGAAGLHRDHRLAARDPARDPAELARVADRLQVEQHDLGALVVLPVLQQVVAGDVGAVAGRDERRQAQAAAGHVLQDRHAERAGLAEEAGPAARRHHRRQRGVERVVGGGVDDAQRVGADEPQPVGAAHPHQLALQPAALVAGLGEPGGDHHEPVHALVGAVEHHVGHRLGRYGDHGDVDLVGDVADAVVGRHARHRARPRSSRRTPGPGSRRARGCAPAAARRCRCGGWRRPPRRCAASKNRWIEAVSARCSRACITSREVTVGSMENSRSTTPSSKPPPTL